MQQLLNIRKTIGIGQTSLAAFLGMTRQGLAKAEKGMCSLSIDSLVKLSRLQACLENLAVTDDKKQITVPIKCGDDHNREKECRYFAALLQRRLLSYEATFQKSMRFHQALCLLAPTAEADELWIQKMKNEIIKKLGKCGTAACMRLRKRIYLLTAEADYISRFVNENQSNHENH